MPIQKAKVGGITRDGINDALYGLGTLTLDLEATEIEMQRQIDEVRVRYSERLEALRGKIEQDKLRLRAAVEESRQDLFTGRSKTVFVVMGEVGFRSQPRRIGVAKGREADDVISLMEHQGLFDLVRIVKEINKPAMSAALAENVVAQETLERCGIEIRGGQEDFWWKPDRAEISDRLKRER